MLLTLDIHSRAVVADGAAFGSAGAYERLTGSARGEIDPRHDANRGIALIDQAPRNARGRVEYQCDVCILRPRNAALGNARMLYEVNNRGRKMLFGNLADGPQGINDPDTLEQFGNGFPLRRGYTLVWSGWDADAPRAQGGLGMHAPVASEAGQPLVRTIRDEFVSGTRLGVLECFRLSHEAVDLTPAHARLTVRERAADRPTQIPPDRWTFLDNRSIALLPAGTLPRPGVLYELRYAARNPKVLGLGFAATRDVVSWLRHGPEAPALTGPRIEHVLAIGISQAARYLRDHISQGFNGDEQGRRVFDGVLAHIGGVGRLFFNTPFGQPWRTNTQHEDHDYPENAFPFSTAFMQDPLSGTAGSLFRHDGNDPLLMETNTSTEYWQKGASLLHTDPLATRDVTLPPRSRVYLIAGTQHAGRAGASAERGPNINARNPHNPMPALRALLVALDEWVVDGTPPPPSCVPTLADGTLVEAGATGFPPIPGAAVMHVTNTIAPPGDWVDPQPARPHYRALVCKVDEDGNEVAGIRLPDIAVPRATYTGWNAYAAPWLSGELADRDGSFLPFPASRAAREAAGDPRRAIAERYADVQDYVEQVRAAAAALVAARLLLQEDAERYLERARQTLDE